MKQRSFSTIRYILVIIISILIFLPITVVFSRYDGLYFFSYLVFWTLLPGLLPLLLAKQIFDVKLTIPKTVYAVVAFLIGVFILFCEFFLLQFLGLTFLISYINPILSIITIIFIIAKFRRAIPSVQKLFPFLSNNLHFLFILLICVYICAFTMNFFMPDMRDINYADYTWQIGNINQLASDHPFDDIRVTGVRFTYHFFNILFLAIAKIVFGGDGWIYLTQYQIMYIPILLCLCVFPLVSVVIKNRLYSTLLSLFMLSGFSMSYQFSDLTYQWASNANATGLAVIISITLFFTSSPILHNINKFDKRTISHIILSLVLFFLLCGVKGPFAIVFITAFTVYYLISVLKNHSLCPVFGLMTSLCIIIFFVTFNTLLSSGSSGYFAGNFLDGFLATVNKTGHFSTNLPFDDDSILSRLIFLIPSLFMTITIAIIPLFLSVLDMILYLLSKKKLSPEYILSGLISYVGIAAYYTFFIEGTSQIYFLYCALPFIFYISVVKLSEIKSIKLKIFSLIVIFLFSINSLYHGVVPNLSDFSVTAMNDYFLNNEKIYDTQTDEEFASFEFLKEYISDDRLILSTRLGMPGEKDAVYHNISAFSEKKCYFEGFLYAERNLGFTDSDVRIDELGYIFSDEWTQEEKYNFQRSKNIGYIVIFSHSVDEIVHPEQGSMYRQIFNNISVTIYELLQ